MGSSLAIISLKLAFHLWLLTAVSALKQSYIVYMGSHPPQEQKEASEVTAAHHVFLGSVLGSGDKARDSIFYSYTKFINGFAAVLEEEDAGEISKFPEVLGVFPDTAREIQTTRSWQFLGLEGGNVDPAESLWTRARFGEDVIIANLDTGVWPESASFSDEGLGPVPSRWKGVCEEGSGVPVKCNRKLIGARFFNKGYLAAGGSAAFNTSRDVDGHGTHTLATAGGAFVAGANVLGYGGGTAKGGAPRARVAAYCVCWPRVNGVGGCYDADILTAIEAAISDGVDIISLSVGGPPRDYLRDAISIGSFHAVQRGISVVASAGNSGPRYGTVSNLAPWVFTVAASTMDREFSSSVIIENGTRFKGQSLSTAALPKDQFFPLIVSSNAAAADASRARADLCFFDSLDPEKVKGKIVICSIGNISDVVKGIAVSGAGGVGMIVPNSRSRGYDVEARAFLLPALSLSYEDGQALLAYANSKLSPVASISAPSTELGTRPAPFMAYFSSRGPNSISPQILKPDITAPGARVVAAFSGAASPSGSLLDTRRIPFNVFSGTSMSCPHVAGVVGLLKTLRPDWSPAALKSAIMTTATNLDNRGQNILDSFFLEANPFIYGSGHIQPNRAADPGLVYDVTPEDYLNFLCAEGYSSAQLAIFQRAFSCPPTPPQLLDFNYPSISVPSLTNRTTVNRRVKNVGLPSTYTAQIQPPEWASVTVEPDTLVFSREGEEKTFSVTFEAKAGAPRVYSFGLLTWSDRVHSVMSPLIVATV